MKQTPSADCTQVAAVWVKGHRGNCGQRCYSCTQEWFCLRDLQDCMSKNSRKSRIGNEKLVTPLLLKLIAFRDFKRDSMACHVSTQREVQVWAVLLMDKLFTCRACQQTASADGNTVLISLWHNAVLVVTLTLKIIFTIWLISGQSVSMLLYFQTLQLNEYLSSKSISNFSLYFSFLYSSYAPGWM